MRKEKVITKKQFPLTPLGIDELSAEIQNICEQLKIDRKVMTRYRLSIEESLIKWMNKSDGTAVVEFEMGKRYLRPFLKISVAGESLNPYLDNSDIKEYGIAGKNVLVNIGLVPEYIYEDGKNVLIFNVARKQKNQIAVLLFVIAASVLVSVLGKLLLPANTISFMTTNIISPIEDAFFRVLSAIAGPMIFLSVAWGVYGIGDVYTLGRLGKRLMKGFLAVVFCFAALGCLVYPFLGPSLSTDFVGGNQFSKILEMILGIFPSDIFSPFINGNTLQIIFLAFLIGLSMIFLGQRTSSIARAVEQINHIITFLMTFVSKLVPYFVFIVLVNIIWSGDISVVTSTWKFGLTYICAAIVLHIGFLIFVSIRCKENPLWILKSVFPSYLIALSTASSSATFESNISIANNKFGIKKELSSFGIPFGMVTFKPSTALYYLLICFYFAGTCSVKVSISWIITAFVIAAVSSVATPPIPGGASATYTILFLQLGIPASCLAVVLAVDMLIDFLLTSGDMYMLLLELLHISEKTGMRKKE